MSIPNILFNSFVSFTVNYGLLSKTTLSDNPYNFYTLSLNSLASSSTNVSSVIAIKYILDNLLHTTKIVSFPTTNSNFMMKSTFEYIYSFSSILLNFNFSVGTSVLFFIYHNYPNIFLYLSLLLATSSFLLLILLSSIFLYIQLLAHYNVTKLSLLSTLYPLAYISFFLTPSLLLSTIHPFLIL